MEKSKVGRVISPVRLFYLVFLTVFTIWMTHACNSNIGPIAYIDIIKYEYTQQDSREQYIPTIEEQRQIFNIIHWLPDVNRIVIKGASSYKDMVNRARIAQRYVEYYEYRKRNYRLIPYVLWPIVLIWFIIELNLDKFFIITNRVKDIIKGLNNKKSLSQLPTIKTKLIEADLEVEDSDFIEAYRLEKSNNYFKALEFYKKSAEKGNAKAMYNLGVMYRDGFGCRQDFSVAKEWFGKACDAGYQPGCNEYAKLNKAGY